MKNLSATICMTISLLLGGAGLGWGADFYQPYSDEFYKGLNALQRGDVATALRELKPLAEKGDEQAQYFLGAIYTRGEGVPQDHKAAMKWYRLAAEQGNARAQRGLGLIYLSGLGVPQNYKMAIKWFRLAAQKLEPQAQTNLGVMYLKGQGVLQDYRRAHMWFNIAGSHGDKNGEKLRDMVAKQMTPSQIEKAQDFARECEKEIQMLLKEMHRGNLTEIQKNAFPYRLVLNPRAASLCG